MILHQIKGCIWLYRCDWCSKEFQKRLNTHVQTHGCCRSCGSKASRATVKRNLLEKHGVENVGQLASVREKVKKTSLERYGVECSWQAESVKQQIKNTMLANHGVEYPHQSSVVRDKMKQRNIEKYGVEHPWMLQEIREKSKQTMIERYGVDNPQKSEAIKEKTQNTCLKRYGYKNPKQVPAIYSRIMQTCLQRYDATNPFGSKICRDKSKITSLKKYGYEFPMQSPEVQQRLVKSFFMKGKGFVSKVELRCYEVIKELFPNAVHQVSINSWVIDFHIPEIDTYIQFDGVYWHGTNLTEQQIRNPQSKREKDILSKRKRDAQQIEWFSSNAKRLIRITDEQFKFWESNEIVKSELSNLLLIKSFYEQ